MRSAGVHEVEVRDDDAAALVAADKAFRVERHGEPVGFYVPLAARDREAGKEALDELGEVIEDILASTGMSEEEFVAEFIGDSDVFYLAESV